MSRQSNWLYALGLGLGVSTLGCANFVDGDPKDEDTLSAVTAGKRLSAALVRAKDCPDLLAKLKEDAIAKLDLEIELFKAQLQRYDDPVWAIGGISNGGGDVAVDRDAVGGAPPPMTSAGEATGGSGSTGGTNGGTGGALDGAEFNGGSAEQPRDEATAGPIGGSDTNNQVRDVDEADFVKMVEDRTRFYLLHGQDFYTFDSWPADALAQVGTPLSIEGNPQEMFVRQGKAIVFSWLEGYELGLSADDRTYQPFTKLTVLDLKGDAARVTREVYVEGSYTSSRRHDGVVRVVLQSESPAPTRFYPDIQAYDDFGHPFPEEEIDTQLEAWRERTKASIEASELSDWLPTQYERVDGDLAAIEPACADHYTPTAGASEGGLTRIVSLDLDDVQGAMGGLTVLGRSSHVYSNLGAMVLAHNDYRWDARDFGLIDEQRVALHLFAIGGDQTEYRASGWAPGHVLDQFALDEKDGVVRVSTSGWVREDPDAAQDDESFWNTTPRNQVVTLKAKEGELKVAGDTGAIGKERETTRSTRFIGDRAYVVTFLQTDPLIVIDLSNPEKLEVLGELEIPGFSEYMHPLGDHHLLTIGQNGTEVGLTGGIALQIFDVKNPTEPKLAHRYEFSPSSSSSASYDHKAFTFYDAEGLLAFPMVDWGNEFQSTLQVFRVGTDSGFEALGAVDHTGLYDSCAYQDAYGYVYYECWYQPDVRRGMFVEGEDGTYVYTVSYGGVTSHAVSDLESALGTVKLPEPKYYSGGYYEGGGIPVDGVAVQW